MTSPLMGVALIALARGVIVGADERFAATKVRNRVVRTRDRLVQGRPRPFGLALNSS
jgi:hypothetical protein